MALYLGNQKVSLRSGQDPTFDYGFDSNGRLVFANKNAKEINNFLNYDSSYSEILDLSNLSKMEKVAVNGTADRKMEGLKGLLVSPNAPFTGSSPQINVSYTGLNKSALVSLFESVPYNVGYTKVGNPTIVDGIVSGFSSSDYLKTSTFSVNGRWKVVVKFKYTETTGTKYVIGNANTFLIKTYNNYLAASIKENGSSRWDFNKAFSKTLQDGEVIWFCLEFDGTKYDMSYSSDGDSYTILDTYTSSVNISPNNNINFGFAANEVFPGSIDLNETYIKVNGVNWFTGAATRQLDQTATNVGGVTITNGVASGFSDSKYIKILQAMPANPSSVEIGFNFSRTKITESGAFGLFDGSAYKFAFYTGSNNVIQCLVTDNKSAVYKTISQGTSTATFFRILLTRTELTAYESTDGVTYIQTLNDSGSFDTNIGIVYFGTSYLHSNWKSYIGNIDLNNTYIVVDGVKVFAGMVPMTKTCSIVGATGAADLTQEDKNIILNKGWSLTVQ